MNTDLVRFVDSISRDKNIDKESIFLDLEAAMVSAARKAFDDAEDVMVSIDRTNGTIQATVGGNAIDMKTLGRIAAQTAKQVMIQKIREDERSAIFDEYSARVGEVVAGTVTRFESSGLAVNLGRGEGFLPRSEQIPGDLHHPGERIRAMILNVREEQSHVKIILTQAHPDYIRRLFEMEVPEVAERVIEIRALAREAGYRTKVAVSSIDSKVDAVGACVGMRGSRIRNIVDELGGEKIDIVRWNESSQVLITNSLKPAEVREVFLCFELGRATVIVDEDQLSLAIGKRGQNVRLGARLTGWDIDILTPAEYNRSIDDLERALRGIDGVEDIMLDKMLAMGIVSLADLEGVGMAPLVKDLGMEEALAVRIVEVAATEAKRLAVATEAAKRAAAEAASSAAVTEEAQVIEEGGECSDAEAGTPLADLTAAPPADGTTLPVEPPGEVIAPDTLVPSLSVALDDPAEEPEQDEVAVSRPAQDENVGVPDGL
ncbi:MAG: transcription termination factor NusA [Planctomycetes bacterium]|nr:transcription termination factor NusA [Planctomycetota bacterium]